MKVKELTRGNKTLIHSRYHDMFGFLRDSFEIIHTDPNGMEIHKPFMAPIKVNDFTHNSSITTTTDYTDAEYEVMLTNEPQ